MLFRSWLLDEKKMDLDETVRDVPEAIEEPAAPADETKQGPRRRRRRRGGARHSSDLPGNRGKHLAGEGGENE